MLRGEAAITLAVSGVEEAAIILAVTGIEEAAIILAVTGVEEAANYPGSISISIL